MATGLLTIERDARCQHGAPECDICFYQGLVLYMGKAEADDQIERYKRNFKTKSISCMRSFMTSKFLHG